MNGYEIKSQSTEVEVGDRIYYTGDMANPSDWGTVTVVHGPDRWNSKGSFELKHDSDHHISHLNHLNLSTGPGLRFITEKAYYETRARKIAQSQAEYRRLGLM